MMAVPVVVDCDTGVDDALALLVAVGDPALDLRAVTCVQGNADVARVVRNTLVTLDAAGAGHMPVARGADRPLIEPAGPVRRQRHGDDGMADLGWPDPPRRADPRPAVELLRGVLTGGAPVTVVTLGPLTNLALALRAFPAVIGGIAQLVAVGGGRRAGDQCAPEFNLGHDPEATHIVLAAAAEHDIAVTLYGADVFFTPAVSAEQIAAVPASPRLALAAGLVRFCLARDGTDRATIGDAGALCAVADPAGLQTDTVPVRMQLAGPVRGQLVVDGADPHATPVRLARSVAGDRYAARFLAALHG
jgi:pyrimidine-specific ribonucleoside hydrolase